MENAFGNLAGDLYTNQKMHAVNGDDSHEDHGRDADDHSRVVEGRGHGHHANADVHLDQVNQGLVISESWQIFVDYFSISVKIETGICDQD
jgi:hypothetical protein